MGYLWFAYKEGSDVLTFFSVNTHHNKPKNLVLSFLSGGMLTVSPKMRFLGRFLDFHIKSMFSDTTTSTDKIELNHLTWMITKGV